MGIESHDHCPATTFYFTRYLLPVLPSMALLAGFGVVHGASWAMRLAGGRAVRLAPLVLGLSVAVPPAAVNCPVLHAIAAQPDARSALSTIMLEKLPAGSRIAVMANTRWAESPAERGRFKLSSTNLVRALFNLPDPAAVDYILMPVSVAAGGRAFPKVARHAGRVNAWLNRGPSVLASGDRPMEPGDVLTPDPGVRVVRNDTAFAASWRPEPPTGILFGAAFDTVPPIDRGQSLSGSGVALRPGLSVVAPLRFTTHTTALALRARGTSQVRQAVPPLVGFDIAASTDTAFRASFAHVDFHRERSQGGMQEYKLRMHRTLPSGDYAVRLRPDDMDGLLVLFDWLRVAEGP